MWSAPEKKYQLLWKIWYVFIIHVIIFIWNFAGVWLHESGVIRASPDGIVTHQPHCSGHTGILHFQTEAAKYLEAELIEVKCPYSAKDMKIKDAVKTVPGFFLGMIKCFMIHFVQYYPSFFSWKCFVSIRLITKSMNNVFLETADGYLHLKEDSDYYNQIQGQLYITKKKCCDLVVWTPTDLAIIRIVKDRNWSANIEKIIDFYFRKFIPEVNKK